MRLLAATLIRVTWAGFLIVSSIYCLLAYLPYTYFAFIKAPAYPWMPWLAAHHGALFLIGVVALAFLAFLEGANRKDWGILGVLFFAGVALSVHPLLGTLRNDTSAYLFGIFCIVALPITAMLGESPFAAEQGSNPVPIGYRIPVLGAASLAIVYLLGVRFATHSHSEIFAGLRWAGLLTWTLTAHITVAVVLVSVLNFISAFSARFRRAQLVRLSTIFGLTAILAFWALVRLLSSALSFDGWLAWAYAAAMSASVAFYFYAMRLRWRLKTQATGTRPILPVLLFAVAAAMAFFAPRIVNTEEDWNGILQQTLAIVIWIAVIASVHKMRTEHRSSSMFRFAAIAIAATLLFGTLKLTEIAWAKPLGTTDDEISRSLEAYSTLDASFRTAHTLLGGARGEDCDDRCRIFRQHTNIRNAPPVKGFDLVEDLKPSQAEHPNIFIWVIDSLRPDYLGAYNPKVDFTPNLDEFAKDSLALRNAYTQYGGTTLSVPAIWAGAEILHEHYPQPFDKINSLLKLARTDDYRVMVSRDTVLNDLLPNTGEITNIERGQELWMHQEMCVSVKALNDALDRTSGDSRPVLFFSQPMNLHQFAINNQPKLSSSWNKPGFNRRVSLEVSQVDGCFGQFVDGLKKRNLYDNSIIIVTSDHGDALGEFGRHSHSVTIYPEIMRVPLLIHLPKDMQGKFTFDADGVKTLTDLAPTLYYLLGHRDIKQNPLFGRPLLTATQEELEKYRRHEWFLASDAVSVFGILGDNGRFFYAAYDSPPRSYLYDLAHDPSGTKDIITPALKQTYDREIIDHLNRVAEFYDYRPGMAGFFAKK